ncbi:MAG: HD domain-containing protein [Bacillaceae bacterium]|nr:HD domain-containing protein [Bacillaceae bacterium]
MVKKGIELAGQYWYWGLLLMLVFIVTLIVINLQIKSRANTLRRQLASAERIIQSMNPKKGLGDNLDQILEVIGEVVEAPTYGFYMRDQKTKSYHLKAVRYQSKDFGAVRPSYSGLASYQGESYLPPLTLPPQTQVPHITQTVEGDYPLVIMPIGDEGVIRVGPLKNIDDKTKALLKSLTESLVSIVRTIRITEEIRDQAQIVISSGKAQQKISSVTMDPKSMIDIILQLLVQSLNAQGGFFVERENGDFQISSIVGMDHQARGKLKKDKETLRYMDSLIKNQDLFSLNKEDEAYFHLPPYFAALGMEEMTLLKFSASHRGYLGFWYTSANEDRSYYGKENLQTILHFMQSVVQFQAPLREFSDLYFHILKVLASLLDNLSPYTVGRSELMSRYAIVMAKALGLRDEEIHDIALAAYLSNIGVLGLSSELFQKDGKFSEEEYEMMKLHAEVGSSIVSMITGNERVATLILHHHERMDGFGYPSGLKGEDIPLGSRVIAIAETFLAKVSGRSYRDPLTFDEALELLESAAGTQLDEELVDLFIRWHTEKRKSMQERDFSLGPCWDMLGVPESICEKCPIYGRKEVKCWEQPHNLCQAHGKSCETCFVRTEFINRSMV